MKKAFFYTASATALLAAVFMASCDHKNTNYAELVNKQWNLAEVIHKDSTGTINVPSGVNIIFSDSSRVYGNAGCNNINGGYETTGHDQIGFERVATTMMWCMNMDFETAYLGWLNKVVSYEATADRLELQGVGNDFRLVYTNGGAPRN